MKKRKQWLMLVCIALAVCLVSGGMLYIRQKNNNKKTIFFKPYRIYHNLHTENRGWNQ